MGKKLLYIAGIVVLLLIAALVFLLKRSPAQLDEEATFVAATIPYAPEFNYRQTVNDCGPFNTAAVVRALTEREVSSAQFAEDIGWRLRNNYTIPIGLEMQLKANGLNVEVPNMEPLMDEEKIVYLKQELSNGHPIIVLGARDGFEHYITLLGFDSEKDEFYFYDSFFDKDESKSGHTIDTNGDAPGNRIYSSKELLEFWRGGGMYGLYEWYAIVASWV